MEYVAAGIGAACLFGLFFVPEFSRAWRKYRRRHLKRREPDV